MLPMSEIRNERDVILGLAAGALPSPTTFCGSEWFNIRLSGTGIRYRAQHDEFVYRSRAWISPAMQQRCIGLPVVAGHPEAGTLNTKEFLQRVIGIVVHTFISGDERDELWGVMRVLDRAAAAELINGEQAYDSSPGVVLNSADNVVLDLDGTKLLIEGDSPTLIDHIAICRKGVWTAPGDEPGVEITSQAA
jgi:colicin import membrane protein